MIVVRLGGFLAPTLRRRLLTRYAEPEGLWRNDDMNRDAATRKALTRRDLVFRSIGFG